MKKNLLSIVAITALVALPINLMAQTTVTSSAVHSSATIIQPIKITSSGELNFGVIASSSVAGTFVLNPDGTAGTATNVTPLSGVTQAEDLKVPNFVVNGEVDYTYAITLPASNITLTSGTGETAKTMTVGTFKTSKANNEVIGTLTSGTDNFKVGATLAVGASQPSGVYTGTFTVTANYN